MTSASCIHDLPVCVCVCVCVCVSHLLTSLDGGYCHQGCWGWDCDSCSISITGSIQISSFNILIFEWWGDVLFFWLFLATSL